MKRTFLFLATFAAVAVGCSKNSLVDVPNVSYDASTINFAPSTGLSKANDNGLDQVKGGFEVHALVKDGTNPDLLYFTKPTQPGLSSELIYQFNNVTWGWANAVTPTDKNWPTDASKYPMTFIASFPVAAFLGNYDAAPVTTAYNWTKVIAQEDQGTTQVLHEDYLSAVSTQSAVPLAGQLALLNFKHITSMIQFSAVIPENWTLVVNGVFYHNLHKEGTYNYATQVWSGVATGVGNSQYAHRGLASVVTMTESGPIRYNETSVGGIKAVPQVASAWDRDAFIAEGERWAVDNAITPEAWPTAAATAALATGTYVELQYALVNDKDICVVGRVAGKKYIDEAGVVQTIPAGKENNQFLRVGYKVDISNKALEAGKRYTYSISLGTDNATGGTVLDPKFYDEDGAPGDDSGKNPGDDVNEKAEEIGFSVGVDEWVDADGSFEPLAPVVPVP